MWLRGVPGRALGRARRGAVAANATERADAERRAHSAVRASRAGRAFNLPLQTAPLPRELIVVNVFIRQGRCAPSYPLRCRVAASRMTRRKDSRARHRSGSSARTPWSSSRS